MYQLLRRLHFYAGILVAPFLLLAAVTGGLYAIAPTVEQFVYRDVLTVTPAGPALPLNQQIDAARAAHPDRTFAGLRPPADDTESTRVLFELGEETQLAVFVDPYTGRVLGDETVWFGSLPLSTWLDGLHANLHLGDTGALYSELAASWLWVVALGGLLLWLRKARNDRRRNRAARVLTVDRATTGRARTLNWHGATGVWIVLALLFLSATGLTWSTYAGANVKEVRTAMDWQRPKLDTGAAPQTAGGHEGHEASTAVPQTDFDRVVATAAEHGVTAPVEITASAGGALSVAETDKAFRPETDSVAIDPASGRVTATLDYNRDYSLIAKLADWGIRGHMGTLFGLANQLVLLATAIALVTLIGRGYLMWWQRRPARGGRLTLGKAPRRGAVRRMNPIVLLGITLVTAAIGWFLPVLGVSLLAFLVVDVIVGQLPKGQPSAGSIGSPGSSPATQESRRVPR